MISISDGGTSDATVEFSANGCEGKGFVLVEFPPQATIPISAKIQRCRMEIRLTCRIFWLTLALVKDFKIEKNPLPKQGVLGRGERI